MPPVAGLSGFLVVLVLQTRRFNLGSALFIGSITALFLGTARPLEQLLVAARALLRSNSLELLFVVFAAGLFSHLLTSSGLLEELMAELARHFRQEVLMVFAPLVIGLALFNPGGALASAAVIERLAPGDAALGARKSALNLWFRAGGRLLVPFIPSLLLVAQLAQLTPAAILYSLAPLTVVTILSGLWLLRGLGYRTENQVAAAVSRESSTQLSALLAGAPLALVLVLSVFGRTTMALLVGSLLILLWIRIRRGYCPLTAIRAGCDWRLVWSVAGVLAFRQVLLQMKTVEPIIAALAGRGLSIYLLAFGIPFVAAVIMASGIAPVGITAPVLLPLVPWVPNTALFAGMIYYGASLGFFVSPLSVDVVSSNHYFGTPQKRFYRELVLPLALSLASVVLLTLLPN